MRPQDWSPLAAGDPIPGDPGRVAELARKLGKTSRVIKGQSARLRGVKTGWWKGPAATEFVKHQEKLPPLLDDVADRYDSVRGALDQYYPTLEEAQAMSEEALQRAKVAEADIARARQGLEEMRQHELAESARVSNHNSNNPDDPPATPAPWSGPNWGAALSDAEADMTAARQLLEDAKGLRDEGAECSAAAIRDAVDDGLKNEGGLLGFVKGAWKGFTENVLPVLADIASFAATILAIASLVFPVLAPFALIAAGISLGLELLQVAAGKGSWTDVAIGVLGIASFGLGRVAGAAAKGIRGARSAYLGGRAAQVGVAGRIAAPTGARVSGAAARSTAVSQHRLVARHYETASRLRSPFPSASEFRTSFRALRSPTMLRASAREQLAAVTGKIDPAIAGSVPYVTSLGDIAPKATRLTRSTVALDIGNIAMDITGKVTKPAAPGDSADAPGATAGSCPDP